MALQEKVEITLQKVEKRCIVCELTLNFTELWRHLKSPVFPSAQGFAVKDFVDDLGGYLHTNIGLQ